MNHLEASGRKEVLLSSSLLRLRCHKTVIKQRGDERVCSQKMFLKEKDFKGVQLRKGNNKMNKKAVNKNVIF